MRFRRAKTWAIGLQQNLEEQQVQVNHQRDELESERRDIAQQRHGETGRPTLILDVGSLLGSLVGQTEQNIRQGLRIADAMQPAVLMIDEVEKALSGVASSGSTDTGCSSAGTTGGLNRSLMIRPRPFWLLRQPAAVMHQVDELLLGDIRACGVRGARHAQKDALIDRLRFVSTFERLVRQITRRRRTALFVQEKCVPGARPVLAVAVVAPQPEVGVLAS